MAPKNLPRSASGLPTFDSLPLPSTPTSFVVGAVVEYNSASQGAWIAAKVTACRDDGLYDLDCKPGVGAHMIRAQEVLFEIGSIVAYDSESQGAWIPARVVLFDPSTGLYDLDCKPSVPASKIKLPPSPRAKSSCRSRTASPPTFGLSPGSSDASPRSLPEQRSGASSSREQFVRKPPCILGPLERVREGPPPAAAQGPLQLVSVRRQEGGWKLEVNEDAVRVLEAYGQRGVAVATMCGPCRTGKSYMLNLLLGNAHCEESQFRVGSTTKACTEGIWMWAPAGDEMDARGTALIFMDCEGFGSTVADKTRDAKLMALCLLLSSLFMLNTKGVLNEGLFNELSLVVSIAELVDERSQEANKPVLLWLLRDFILELADESGVEISSDEYLENCLNAQPLAGANADRSRGAREARKGIKRFFLERHCTTFVRPVINEEELSRVAETPLSDLRPQFRSQLEAMQAKLAELAETQPKTIGGQTIGGPALAGLTRKLVDALNSGKKLDMRSTWDDVQHSGCSSLVGELRAEARMQFQRIASEGATLPGQNMPLPVSDKILEQVLKEWRRSLKASWRARAFGDEQVRQEYWKELKDSIRDEEQALARKNAAMGEETLRLVRSESESWPATDGHAAASDPLPESLGKIIELNMPGQAKQYIWAKPAAMQVVGVDDKRAQQVDPYATAYKVSPLPSSHLEDGDVNDVDDTDDVDDADFLKVRMSICLPACFR